MLGEGLERMVVLAMGVKERDRLKVLAQVKSGKLAPGKAAGRLKLSARQLRRLRMKERELGDAALVLGNRGRPSNRRMPAEEKARDDDERSGPVESQRIRS